MQNHGHGLSSFRGQRYTWTAYGSSARGVRRKLTSNNFRERYASPPALAQQFMRVRQRLYPMIKRSNEGLVRAAAFMCLLDDRAHCCEHVFDAMVEFSI